MAAVDLPSEFDVVIFGTGLVESVVAAACSRVGQRVLHLDRRSYYAGHWASFTFNGLQDLIRESQEQCPPEEQQDYSSLLNEGEKLMYLSQSDSTSISNVQIYCFTSDEDETEKEEDADVGPISTRAETSTESLKDTSDHPPNTADSKPTPAPGEQQESGDGQEQAAQVETALPSDSLSQSESPRKKITMSHLLKHGRRFNIDLVSKLMFSRGSLVDLLIKSNVSRYAEFKNVSRVLTCREHRVQQVPCSRADVFASRQLSVVEKRKLMRFLTTVVEETEEQEAYRGRPFLDFLSDQQLGENLQHFLLHSIAMVTENAATEDGLAATRHFLRCLGRYGNTPFLFPVYGLGEIPQCFCRMSAVFGGVYCLRHSVHCLLLDEDNRCKAVIDSRGQRISCSHFVVEEGHLTPDIRKVATPPRLVSRAVLITDDSVLSSDSDQQVSLITVPPITAGAPAVKMVELCSSTMTCIPGTYLVHLTCPSAGSAYQDLSPVITRMFKTPQSHDQVNGPSVLWCLYFNMVDGSGVQVKNEELPSNMYICSGPDGDLGHERAISQARQIFQNILPEEEFCPPAPNPEDIIYDGDSAYSTGEEEQVEEPKEEKVEGPNVSMEQKQMVEVVKSSDQGEELE